ncbi:MAG TPA: FAD-binding oxidoreductase [Solirubrobacteraceae bacterium]|nr:FAD-binding oxidoreductase [Solirubrobacteraceae bacterium]
MPELPAMRWWGWGEPGHPPALGLDALAFLREHVGLAQAPRPPVALGAVHLEPPGLADGAHHALREVVGEQGLRTDHGERVLHAAGKGYPDLVRLRAGTPAGAPDAVLHPRDRAQVRALLDVCTQHALAVVPFGGGTSVVGGLAPLRGERHSAVVALDLGALSGIVDLDRESMTVRVRAGMRAPALERELAHHGLTLGHFPQSFEYVSLGGCAATRSAGQASTGYGRFEELVKGLVLVAPAGDLELAATPATAAGPELRRVVVGSEGTLGVIAELSLRVRAAPAQRLYEGAFFRDFAAGVQALRALSQEHVAPAVARLSDEAETMMSLALAGGGGLKGRLGRSYLGLRGYAAGCLAILGFEGSREEVGPRRKRALALLRAHDGLPVGSSPGEAWLAQRFAAPYLRDELLTHGVLVETLETATRWSELERLHDGVGDVIARALAAQGTPGLVMCHVSHLYETGASLYFTFLARQRDGEEIAQWQTVKRAACEAIVDGGGTITHHHAVGRDHAPWLEREIGGEGVGVLQAIKQRLDPAAIMNPGKLLFR